MKKKQKLFNIGEYKEKVTNLSDYLPWALLVAPGVVLNKDGSFQKTYSYRGRDLKSATYEEMMVCVAQLNNILRRLPGNWCLYIEARRERNTDYPQKKFPDLISAMIDAERKVFFSRGYHYESTYYFTLQYLPPQDRYDRLEKVFIERHHQATQREYDRIQEHLRTFSTEVYRVYIMLCEVMAECKELTDDETLTYLHSCVSNKNHPVKTPQVPVMLDALLYDTPLLGGWDLVMGSRVAKEDQQYLTIISVMGFPPMTEPGILDELNRMEFEYRWVTRYLPIDKVDANHVISKLRREWFAKRKSMLTLIKETIFKSESAMVEEAALERYNDAQSALLELETDIVNFGYFKTTIVVKHKDPAILKDTTQKIEKVINRRGFVTKKEDVNALSAWKGTLPGMARDDVRWPMVSSLNLAHMFPISAVWAGDKWNNHLNAPPLMQTQTSGSTPFRLNLHIGDVGNCMIVGPVGSGKSVLLNMIEAQYRGYSDAQVYIFDKGGSCRALTAGVGGDFYDLADEGTGVSFQPLAHVDEESERIWAAEWLQMIFEQENVALDPQDKKDIWNALSSMAAAAPLDERTMSGFYMTVQNQKLKDALQQFILPIPGLTEGGPYGRLFDSDHDSLSYGRWQAFEMGELMGKKGAVMPTLQYLFHVIEKRCNGSPTIIVLDESWVYLDNPLFADKIREWFKTMRKNNVAIVFATQNLQDVANSRIAPAIIENCFTRIFLPNPNAMNESEKEIYKLFDINDTERHLIAAAIPKRQYYYKSRRGSRMFELALEEMPLALAYVASASKEDQKECRRILSEYPREEFNEHWLKYKNQMESLKLYQEMKEGL